jgi:tetratricopeptide (TPR) repeat protein
MKRKQSPAGDNIGGPPKDSAASLYDSGLRHFRSGRYPIAEERVRRALLLNPEHADALYLMGLLHARANKIDRAIDFVVRASRINQGNPEYFVSLGELLDSQGRFEEALKCYNVALKLKPDCAGVWVKVGDLQRRQERFEEALFAYERALVVDPSQNATYHANLAKVLVALACPSESESHFREALRLDAGNTDALMGLGNLFRGQKRVAEALVCFFELVRLQPDIPQLHAICGNLLQDMGRLDEAELHYREACRLKPGYPEVFNNLGSLLQAVGRLSEAEELFRHALSLKLHFPEARNNLGNLLLKCRRAGEAEAFCREALRLRPDYALAHNNLANILVELDDDEAAEFHYREAIRLRPDHAEAHNNFGTLLGKLGRLDDAEAFYRRAVELLPDYHEAHSNLGMTLLAAGKFEEGWRTYDTHRKIEASKDLTGPQWAGENLDGRVLLIYAEQGYGDMIQFSRFLPLVGSLARVILEVPRELVELLAGLPGIDQIVARGDPLPPYDVHCALVSLPRWLDITVERFLGDSAYLSADSKKAQKWQNRVEALPGLSVGLAWAGNPALAPDRMRSIGLDRLGPLADISGVSFVSLQKGEAAQQTSSLPAGMKVHDWTAELHDFSDTAALISVLDLVITVDTSVVHLTGALGRPVWLLNRFNSCWRWQIDSESSPWYKTLRQFKQPELGDWASVVGKVKTALATRVAASVRDLLPVQRMDLILEATRAIS